MRCTHFLRILSSMLFASALIMAMFLSLSLICTISSWTNSLWIKTPDKSQLQPYYFCRCTHFFTASISYEYSTSPCLRSSGVQRGRHCVRFRRGREGARQGCGREGARQGCWRPGTASGREHVASRNGREGGGVPRDGTAEAGRDPAGGGGPLASRVALNRQGVFRKRTRLSGKVGGFMC
jgi:hypothetical protein